MSLTPEQIERLINFLDENPELEFFTLRSSSQLWQLVCGFLVFYMHAGFACLEAGAVRSKNTINILFKNFMTVSIGAIMFFLLGWGFAYGEENAGNNSSRFIGNGDYALSDSKDNRPADWFFQMVFAATCATIVSGAVAERTKLPAYLWMAAYLTGLVYPVVAHWAWSGHGWLDREAGQVFNESRCGYIDFAGSGVVHLTGGVAGLVGAWMVGPRKGRFEILSDGRLGKAKPLPGHNLGLSAIGTFILWFGWYGFNCGSTLAFDPVSGDLASRVAVTTSISASSACIAGVLMHFAYTGTWDLGVCMNCILAGLVSITAGCAVVEFWMAIFIGWIGSIVYFGGSKLMKVLKIDDPLDAIAVHGFAGIWGVLAVGIFATGDLVGTYYECEGGNTTGLQFGIQLAAVCAIIAWVGGMSFIGFGFLHLTLGIRVSDEVEENGLDASEHGAVAYELNFFDEELLGQREPYIKHSKKPKAQKSASASANPGDNGAGQDVEQPKDEEQTDPDPSGENEAVVLSD